MDLTSTVLYCFVLSLNFILILTDLPTFEKQNLYKALYEGVNKKLGPQGRYNWKEHSRVHFTCPRGSYISSIAYSYDIGKTSPAKQLQVWSLADTFSGTLLSNNVATFRRTYRETNNTNSIFGDFVKDRTRYKQSAVSRTSCDAVLFCLGHQACLFQLSIELCADDAETLDVKYLKLELNCTSEYYFYKALQPLSSEQQKALGESKDHVMYVSYDKKQTDNVFSVIRLFTLPEREVFSISCPPTSEAHNQGYGGWCKGNSPTQSEISTELWHVIARSTEASCRDELLQVYCAYHYNKTGGCVPPVFVEKPKNGSVLRPGKMRFNFKALPKVGYRPDIKHLVEVRKSPNAALMPVKFAFLIIAHTCEDCVMQLIDLIYRPYFFYVIHVDFRQDEVRNELISRIHSDQRFTNNIRVLPKERSFTASWGSFNILRAELEGIEELARMGAWDFVINLSGADLPFIDVDDMAAMYASYRTRNFVGLRENWKDRRSSVKDRSAWHSCSDHVYNVTSRGPPPSWSTHVSASQWFILDRGFATTIINQNHRSKRLNNIQFFQQTCIVPDESYLQSLLFNSDFRYTFVYDHSRLYNFPKTIHDNRGLCKHSSDIDYCGQSPRNFVEHDVKHFKTFTRKYNFGRKHAYNANALSRLAAAEAVRSSVMYQLAQEKGTVTKLFIRSLVEEALLQKFGDRWNKTYKFNYVFKVRILRVPTADNSCCKHIYMTRNHLPYRYKYWIDFSVTDLYTGKDVFMRTSMKPIDNVKCFVNGHIRAISVSFMNDPFVPHESDVDRSLMYYIHFNRGRNPGTQKAKCKELPNQKSDIYDSIQPKNSSRYKYAKFQSDKLFFKVMLISPSGNETCEWNTVLTLTKFDNWFKKNTRFKIKMKKPCVGITPGRWHLVLQQAHVENPFPYTVSMFVGHSGDDKQTISDNIRGLWNLEGLMEISAEDINLQAKWSRATPLDSLGLKKELPQFLPNISRQSNEKSYEHIFGLNKSYNGDEGHMVRKLREEKIKVLRNNIKHISINEKTRHKWFMLNKVEISLKNSPTPLIIHCIMITSVLFVLLRWLAILRKWNMRKFSGAKSIAKSTISFLVIYSIVYLTCFLYLER